MEQSIKYFNWRHPNPVHFACRNFIIFGMENILCDAVFFRKHYYINYSMESLVLAEDVIIPVAKEYN